MVRPRLVEEGAPIYGPGSDLSPRRVNYDDHDHDMHEGDPSLSSPPPPAAAATAAVTTTTTSTKPMSSLQRVAKASGLTLPCPRHRGPTLVTNYEVGRGGRTDATWKGSRRDDNSSLLSFVEPSSQSKHSHLHLIQTHHTTVGGGHDRVEDTMEVEADPPSDPVHSSSTMIHSTKSHSNNNYHHHHHRHADSTSYSYTIGGKLPQLPPAVGPLDKMVGVEDQGQKSPLVVVDGANVAHAYGTAWAGMYSKERGAAEPHPMGIDVAVRYFGAAGVRVLVVLPQFWFGSKGWNTTTVRVVEHQQILKALQEQGLMVASPPADDDDAYALTIARREEARSLRRPQGEGPGFILSNDMFRDAQARDSTGALTYWLNKGRAPSIGPGRISYSFADMGTMNDHGERILDFVPNPRHPFVIWMENEASLYSVSSI